VSSERTSVLFVIGNGGRGGMQAQVRLVADALAARGHEVTVAVGGTDPLELEVADSATLPALGGASAISFARDLRRLARELRVDVIHGHGLRLAPFVAVAGAPKRFVTCHGIDPTRAAPAIRLARASRVPIVSCGEGPQRLLAEYGLRSVVLDNALSPAPPAAMAPPLPHDLDSSVPLVVLPARFSEQKGHDVLVEAMRLVRLELGDTSPEVLCVGDGPLFDHVTALAAVPGGRPLVRCLPYQAGAAAWLDDASFFVLPSRWEGQPQIVLEALASGLPVATTTPVGVEDLIVDGRNGRRLASVTALAEVIVEWTRTPELMPRDETLNESILARHDLSRVVERYEAFYGWTRPTP
jgi:glycosyltransferase involved in cell wall biosynthesis